MSLGEGGKLMEQGSRPPAPPEFSEFHSAGEGPHPHLEVSMGSERGAPWAHPHPQSDTRARGGREGEARSPKQQRAERRAAAPPPGGWGSQPPALPVPSPGASPLLRESPPGWEPEAVPPPGQV